MMKDGLSCKLGLGLGVALLLMGGCADLGSNEATGTARVRIEASRTDQYEITRVTIEAEGGFETELIREGETGFAGSLLLPAGPNSLVGRAFNGAELVGVSAPVAVDIQAGLVASATIRILDITGGQDIGHSPIVLSLTHPLSTVVNQPALLEVTAVDPDGDSISAAWISECEDALLSSPDAFATEIILLTAGSCRVHVILTDGALSTVESFNIVAFDENPDGGAVNLGGEFVSAPQINLDIYYANTSACNVHAESEDGTCQGTLSSPTRPGVGAYVFWGNAMPGSVELTKDCGGDFVNPYSDPNYMQVEWVLPLEQTVCLITARAVSGEGMVTQVTAAILVRDGEPPPPANIQAFAQLYHSDGECFLNSGESTVECSAVRAGNPAFLYIDMVWDTALPGVIEVRDDCGGSFFEYTNDPFNLQADWTPPSTPEQTCTLQVNAQSLDGQARTFELSVPLF